MSGKCPEYVLQYALYVSISYPVKHWLCLEPPDEEFYHFNRNRVRVLNKKLRLARIVMQTPTFPRLTGSLCATVADGYYAISDLI